MDYKFLDELSFRAGKAKLPYSHIALTLISKQLLVKRSVSIEKTIRQANGRVADGVKASLTRFS